MKPTPPQARPGRSKGSDLLLLAALFIAALFLWDWLYPLRIFTVLLHETGHALAAVLTGGSVSRIELYTNEGGLCFSRGGVFPVVLSAGYLGSLLFGGLIMVGAARSRHDRAIAVGIGVAVLLVTVLWVRSLFGFVFSAAAGIGLVAMGRLASARACDLTLRFIGLTSCLYAVIDIKDDLITRPFPGSDAWQMSEILPLPPVFFGVLWILIALAGTAWFLWLAARGEREGER